MQKLIGCILVFIACTAMGVSKGQDLEMHLKELEKLRRIFLFIRSELQYTRAPFEEIFEKVEKKNEGIYARWLEVLAENLHKGETTFEEIWRKSIEEQLSQSRLTKEERQELKNVGKTLEHIETIDLYLEQLEYQIHNKRKAYQSKKKIYQSMGISGGIFLGIILL